MNNQFVAFVYSWLNEHGYDTKGVEPKEAIEIYKRDVAKNSKATDNEKKRMEELGIEGKVKTYNPKMKQILLEKNKDYRFEKLSVKDLIKDNNIKEKEDTLNRRKEKWGNDYKDYKLNETEYNYNQKDPIRITKRKNGKYEIDDGMHRLIALDNAGYEYAELLVRDEQ